MSLLPSPPRPDRQCIHWPVLHSSARALAIATAAAADDRPWIVVLPDARALDQLHRELTFFAGDSLPVLHLPDWEVLPYDQYSPLPDLISERLATLARLPSLQRGVVLVSAETLMQRLPPTNFIAGRSFDIAVGQQFSITAASAQLAQAGYSAVAQVGVPGEFALRGSLFDVYPMGYPHALRIDLFDDRIDSIRHFDPDTQRSLDRLQRLRLLPAREFPLDDASCRDFRRRFRSRFEGEPTRSAIYRGLRQNIRAAGHRVLPAAVLRTHGHAFPVPARTATCSSPMPIRPRRSTASGMKSLRAMRIGAMTSSIRCWIRANCSSRRRRCWSCSMLRPACCRMPTHLRARLQLSAPPALVLDARAAEPLAPLASLLADTSGRVLITADSPGRREVLQDLLREAGIACEPVAGWHAFLASTARCCADRRAGRRRPGRGGSGTDDSRRR